MFPSPEKLSLSMNRDANLHRAANISEANIRGHIAFLPLQLANFHALLTFFYFQYGMIHDICY